MRTTNAAIYCRTSVDDKNDPKLSTGSQKEDGVKLARSLNFDVKPDHVFLEIGISGSKPPARWQNKRLTKLNHRPELERMMQAIEQGRIQAVVVRKRDRLFRSLELSLKFFRFMEEHNIQLYATSEKINLDGSASSKLELTLMMAVAEFQLQTTRENILQVKRRQKSEGLKMCRCDVLGYRNGEKKGSCETVPAEVPIIKDIFDRYIAGASLSSISIHLNRLRVRDGKLWHVSHISRIIDNPSYIGMADNRDGELIPSRAYTAIIDPCAWYKAQKLRKSRRNPLHGRRVKEHLLSGLIRCGYCGAKMMHQAKYVQPDRKLRTGFTITCIQRHESQLHPTSIREIFWEELIDTFYRAPLESERADPVETTELKIRLEKLRTNMSDLDKGFTVGHIDYSKYDQLTDMLKINMTKLQTAIASNLAESCVPEKLKPWAETTTDEKRIVIMSRIDTIKVYRDEVVITKGNQISVFPIIKKRDLNLTSRRACSALVPPDLKSMKFVEDNWNGIPCRKLVSI